MSKRKFKPRKIYKQRYTLDEVPKDFHNIIIFRYESFENFIHDEFAFWSKICSKDSKMMKFLQRSGNTFEDIRLEYIKYLASKYEYEDLIDYGISRHIKKPTFLRFKSQCEK